MKLSIVIPAFNEEERIGPMLDAYVPHFAAKYGKDVEFIVVVNGSTDSTEEVMKSYSERYPAVRYLVEPERTGKGGALVLGFKEAGGELVGFADADGSTPPAAFEDLVDNIGSHGAIVASRWRKGAEVRPSQPLKRRVASRMFNFLTRTVFGLRLSDTQCGAKLMTREAMQKVLPHIGITQWAFDVDLLLKLKKAGYSIAEVPTTWHDVPGSKIQVTRVSVEMFVALVRLRLLYSPLRWIVSIYDHYLGPFMHAKDMEEDHLFRHSVFLMAGSQVGNVCNLAFQIAMARMLSEKDFNQLGVMQAMLGLFMIAIAPIGALGRAVAHFIARFLKEGRTDKVKALVSAVARDMLVPAAVVVGVSVLLGRRASGAFGLGSQLPVILVGVALAGAFHRASFDGAFYGMQRFGWNVFLAIAWSVIRLVLGVAFVLIGWQAIGALAAQAASIVFAAVVGAVGLFYVLGKTVARPAGSGQVYRYAVPFMFALVGYGVLAHADVVLVRFFNSAGGNAFAAAVVAARVVLFVTQPIAIAMFPKVVSRGQTSLGNWRTLVKALMLVVLLVGGAALTCTVFPSFVFRMVTGKVAGPLVPVIQGIVWALSPLPAIFILMNFELAQRRFAVIIPLCWCATGYILGVSVWHETTGQVVAVLATANVVCLAATAIPVFRRSVRHKVTR